MNPNPTSKDGPTPSHISPDMVMRGLILSRMGVVVEGVVMGDIHCEQDVVVTGTGTVVGSIISRCATIEGKIEGNLFIIEKLRFQGKANIKGDVLTSSLEVRSISAFNGNCRISPSAEVEGVVRAMSDIPQNQHRARTGS